MRTTLIALFAIVFIGFVSPAVASARRGFHGSGAVSWGGGWGARTWRGPGARGRSVRRGEASPGRGGTYSPIPAPVKVAISRRLSPGALFEPNPSCPSYGGRMRASSTRATGFASPACAQDQDSVLRSIAKKTGVATDVDPGYADHTPRGSRLPDGRLPLRQDLHKLGSGK